MTDLCQPEGTPDFLRPSLRDQFAMAAMTGFIASGIEWTIDEFADAAYELADAMLAERGKRTK